MIVRFSPDGVDAHANQNGVSFVEYPVAIGIPVANEHVDEPVEIAGDKVGRFALEGHVTGIARCRGPLVGVIRNGARRATADEHVSGEGVLPVGVQRLGPCRGGRLRGDRGGEKSKEKDTSNGV